MKTLLIAFFLLCGFLAEAQPYFPPDNLPFVQNIIPRIDITIAPDSLAVIYKAGNENSDHEFPTTFVFTAGSVSDTFTDVGLCLRGNTSRSALKKSFKVDFNNFVHGRKFYGLEKLDLNGEHNDPTIERSNLYWKTLACMKVPGSRANHIDLYINGRFYGLYANVEHIDENFVLSRFGNNDGNLYKCTYPANLDYISNNPSSYNIAAYEQDIAGPGVAFSDLAHLIDVIYHSPDTSFICDVEKVFNLNSFLRAYAVDMEGGNWDDFAYNENNFYLYHNSETGLIEYIPYDVDNTYGVDFLGEDWGKLSIYSWFNSGDERELVKRILANTDLKNRLSYYINELQERLGNPNNIDPYIDSTLTLISPSAKLDSFRTLDYGYTYNDFVNSFTEALNDGHTNYGLKPYVQTRYNTTQSDLVLNDVPPLFTTTLVNPTTPFPGDSIWITSQIEGTNTVSSVQLYYQVNQSGWSTLNLLDDGLHKDGAAGDGLYGVNIPSLNVNDSVHFYIKATDSKSLVSNNPECGYYTIKVQTLPKLYINEWMASNHSTIKDEHGNYADWLEIYNGNTQPVSLKNLYVTDNFSNPSKWALPADSTMPAGSFLLIWADDSSSNGAYHANFKLSSSGEQIGIYAINGSSLQVIDTVSFGTQKTDVSEGCYPDGGKPYVFFSHPTPGKSNVETATGINTINPSGFSINIFPNPASDEINVTLNTGTDCSLQFKLVNMLGQEVSLNTTTLYKSGKTVLHFQPESFNVAQGLYLLKASGYSVNSGQPVQLQSRVLIIK